MSKRLLRCIIIILFGSLLFSILFSLGYEIEIYRTCAPDKVIKRFGMTMPVAMIILTFLLNISKISIIPRCKYIIQIKPTGFRFFAMIFLLYIPMYVISFPGTFCIDTGQQIGQIVTNQYSTNLPLLHTLYLRFCFETMTPILGTMNRAAAFYSFTQTVLLSMCFALTSMSLARSCGSNAGWYSAFFFGLFPMHMIYAGTSTKDVLFSGFFAVTLAYCKEFLNTEHPSRSLVIGIVVYGTLTNMLRGNMIFASIIWGMILILSFNKSYRKMSLCIWLAIVLAWGGNAFLKHKMNASSGFSIRELLSWPLQQMSRARLYAPEQFTEDEKIAFDEIIGKQKWKEYSPTLSDPVKGAFIEDVFYNDMGKYIRLYCSIKNKCPQLFFDAVINHCYTYLYPYKRYNLPFHYIETGIDTGSFEQCYGKDRLKKNELFSNVEKWLDENIWKSGADHIPLLRWIMNLGMLVWIMLFFVIRAVYFGKWRDFVVSLLPVILWLMYLFGPIMYSRYLYSIVCSLPVIGSFRNENNTCFRSGKSLNGQTDGF